MFEGLRPELRPAAVWLYEWARARGLHPVVTSVYRSRAHQARLYRRWLAGVSPYPAAPPGHSLHQFGLAFDMVADDQEAVGREWEAMNGRWGGRFNDPPHFEVKL